MMRNIIILITSILYLISATQADAMIDLNRYSEKIYKPIAVIEDHTITEYDLQQKMAIIRMSGSNVDRATAIDHLIDQEVILYVCKDKEVSEEIITNAIAKIANENGLDEKKFSKLLQEFDIHIDSLKKHMKAQLLLNDMVMGSVASIAAGQLEKKLYGQAFVTQEEIKKTDEVLLQPVSEYIFGKDSQVKIAEMQVKLDNNWQEIVDLLRRGESFAIIKRKFPNTVAISGGEGVIGWLKFGEMSELYQQFVSNVRINQIAEPLALGEESVLFIKLLDVKNAEKSPRYINKDYRKLSQEQKVDLLLKNVHAKLIAANLVNQLKKQLFIQVF